MHHSLRVRPPGVNGLALLLLAGSLCAFPALAQSTYPDKPVHIIVPFPPGGPADGLTRIGGIDMVHVPFNGVAPAMNAVLGGQVQLFFAQSSAALQHVKAGTVVALGVASAKRIAAAPDLPTIAEQGLPGFDVTSWYAIVAPAATPSAIVDRLHAEIARILAQPDVREKFAGVGAEPVGNTPAEFAAMQRAEAARWAKLAHEANIHAD